MQVQHPGIFVFCFWVFLSSAAASMAAQPSSPRASAQITYEHLTALSYQSADVISYRHNEFLYDEAVRQVRRYAEALNGTQLIWTVRIAKVTKSEVVYEFDPAAGTLVTIIPGPDSHEGDSEHRKHRTFTGPRSALLGNLLSAPKTLRIGSAISLDVARRLRRGDLIELIGRVQHVDPPKFSNSLYSNIVYVADVIHYIRPEVPEEPEG